MIPTMACLICNRLVATGGVCPSCASPEDEEFNRVEMESRIKQEYIRAMRKTTREEKISRPAVYEVPAFKPDYNTEAVLVEEMQRMAKRIQELETEQDCVGWFGYDTSLRLWFETNKGDDGAIPLYKAKSKT